MSTNFTPRMKTHYQEKVVPALQEEFKYGNVFEIPRIEKIVINTAISTTHDRDKDLLKSLADDLALIAGQRPGSDQGPQQHCQL